MKLALEFAKELVSKVCTIATSETDYDDELLMVLDAIKNGGQLMLDSTGTRIIDYEDFSRITNIGVEKDEFSDYIKYVNKYIYDLIQGDLKENPNPTFVEAMRKVIYYSIFYIDFEGRYEVCENIYNQILCAVDSGSEELAIDIAKILDGEK